MKSEPAFAQSVWEVREGEEPAFLERWRAMVDHTLAAGAAARFVLLRDRGAVRRYVSIGEWMDLATMRAYRARADFRALFRDCRALCDSFGGTDFDLAAWAPPPASND